MKKQDLLDELNSYEILKKTLNYELNFLNKRLIKFKAKESRAAFYMRRFLLLATPLLIIFSSSLFLSGILKVLVTSFSLIGLVYFGSKSLFQCHAFKSFKRFNEHSTKLYNKKIHEKETIKTYEQEVLLELNKLEEIEKTSSSTNNFDETIKSDNISLDL